MFERFLADWELFQHSYMSAFLLAAALPLSGILVVGKKQEFMGANVAKGSIFTLALIYLIQTSGQEVTGGWLSFLLMSFCGAVVVYISFLSGALPYFQAGLFLSFVALTTLALSHSPQGSDVISQYSNSSLIGAMPLDSSLSLGLLILGVLVYFATRRALHSFILEPEVFEFYYPIHLYYLIWSFWIGATVACALKIGGLLLSFGLLVLPVIIGMNLVSSLAKLPFLCSFLGLVTTLVGAVIAAGYDLPYGAMSIALLSGLSVAAILWGRLKG